MRYSHPDPERRREEPDDDRARRVPDRHRGIPVPQQEVRVDRQRAVRRERTEEPGPPKQSKSLPHTDIRPATRQGLQQRTEEERPDDVDAERRRRPRPPRPDRLTDSVAGRRSEHAPDEDQPDARQRQVWWRPVGVERQLRTRVSHGDQRAYASLNPVP